MAAIPQPSFLKKAGAGSRTIVVTNTGSGGTIGGGVPSHNHDASAIVSGTLANDRLPPRLQRLTPLVSDLNAILDTGQYSANNLTANAPDASFWNVDNIRYGADTTSGNFITQTVHEVVPPYRSYKRSLNVVTWTAWERVDVPYIPFEVAMGLHAAATAPAAASAAANTECFVASKMTRNIVDLGNASEVRLTAMAVTNGNAPAATVKLSYMTTEAATWAGNDAGASVLLGTGTAGTMRDSGWQTLAVGARAANVTVAALVGAAFGTTAPTIGSLTVFFR